jgi:hypothetical protein
MKTAIRHLNLSFPIDSGTLAVSTSPIWRIVCAFYFLVLVFCDSNDVIHHPDHCLLHQIVCIVFEYILCGNQRNRGGGPNAEELVECGFTTLKIPQYKIQGVKSKDRS